MSWMLKSDAEKGGGVFGQVDALMQMLESNLMKSKQGRGRPKDLS